MKDQHEQIDIGFARCCLVANKKNCITAHYYLLKKKKQLMQESFSDFSMLQILDADADLQITTQKNKISNAIVPGGRQVRENHSIPAAPRHNFGNVDIT